MRTAQASASLATKFAVGEIADFFGVPDFYDAVSSKWMKTGAWVAGSGLPAATRTALKSTAGTNTAMTDNAVFAGSSPAICLNTLTPLAKTASVVAIPFTTGSSGAACKALVIDASGIRAVSIGQVAGTNSPSSYGGGSVITSDGTKLWSWTSAAGGKFIARSSTDGILWTDETMSGMYSGNFGTHSIGPDGTQNTALRAGERFTSSATYQLGAYWCGARHLLVGVSTTGNYLTAMLSSNGTTWGGEVSAAVWGGSTLAAGSSAWFYRNGMTCFLSHNDTSRASTDGGVTWAAPTNAQLAAYNYFRINSSDPSRLVSHNEATNMRFSADSGATWTSRTAPLTLESVTVQGRGASWVVCDVSTGLAYKTLDDGATWSLLAAPFGFVGTIQGVLADTNRWYMVSSAGNQVATSTDLITWTVRNIANPSPGTSYSAAPINMVATDALNVMGAGGNGIILSSSDGGVTWAWSSPSSDSVATGRLANYYIANTVGSSAFVCGLLGQAVATKATAILASDLALGGKYFRSTAVTPLREGTFAYSRVA